MFVLATLKDKVKVLPKHFAGDMMQPVVDEIQRLYTNKVIAGVGLCIAVHQVLEMGDMYIYPNEGATYIVTVFNMIVFRPFEDEVLVGVIHSMDASGIKCSLGFFDEVIVSAAMLPTPISYAGTDEEGQELDVSARKWVWEYEGQQMDMVVGDEVRFRALSVDYHEARKDQVKKITFDASGRPVKVPTPYTPPMTVRATMAAQGLGRTEWWDE